MINSLQYQIKIFNCPEPGEGTTEVDILEWLVKAGDKVSNLQQIGRAKYEKADIDILSPYDGIVEEILVDAGDIAIAHKPLVKFKVENGNDELKSNESQTNELKSNEIKSNESKSNESKSIKDSTISSTHIKASPGARHLAKNNNIDLSSIVGSGSRGHVTKQDVENAISKLNEIEKVKSDSMDYVQKIIGVQRAMVKKMTQANLVPQFGYSDEICMDELINTRKLLLETFIQEYNIKLSYLPFILKGISLALLNSPSLNAHVNKECTELTYKSSHNIGIAVDSPNGLIVPNIKNIQSKSIIQISIQLNEIIQRAKTNKMSESDFMDGTFTISNIGAIGGTYCNPVVFVPEVCIGAIGRTQTLPRYNNNNNIIKSNIMVVSWSADHRVIDGATVARFSNEFKDYIQNPSKMLIHLK